MHVPILPDHGLHGPDARSVGWPSIVAEPEFRYGEDLLQFIWERGLFDADRLSTTDGSPVDVLRAGRVQHHGGPDLEQALVRIDGQLWAGSVEVHVKASEWNAHGHQHDPAYGNVVLHVVHRHDADVTCANGHRPPTVEIGDRLRERNLALYQQLMESGAAIPCASQWSTVDPARVSVWLEALLVQRLERRTNEVAALYARSGRSAVDTFYQLLLRGWGAKVNAEPFGMLADALPLRTLQKYRDDPLRTEAFLFGQSGLLPSDPVDAYTRALRSEHEHLVRLHPVAAVPSSAWKFGRLRPANFPTVRVAQLAQLVMQDDGAFTALLEEDRIAALEHALDVQASPYWDTHHRFDEPSRPGAKRFGKAAIHGLVINTLVPFLFALGKVRKHPRSIQRAMDLLEQVPAERNHVLDRWEALGLMNDCASRSQALLELDRYYCAPRRCLDCAIGRELLKNA
ncbi:MAG TPA: DUF2851 family protein [Flavobacteriales bacterium]